MRTVPDLIDALGGNTAFGRICGFEENPGARGSDMRRRASIPIRYWEKIIGQPDKTGRTVTLEDLHRLHRQEAVA